MEVLQATGLVDTSTLLRHVQRPASGEVPSQPGALIGREQLVTEAGAFLLRPDVRLLTLLGMGGIGKTRVAVHLAERLQSHFASLSFVDLASFHESRAAASAIVQAVAVGGNEVTGGATRHDHPSRLLPDNTLGPMPVGDHLVVLDNFEHVLPAAHEVARLLERFPNLKFLVTSRCRLRLRWEQICLVPPLDLPSAAARRSVDAVRRSPAVQLFEVRAQAVAPGYRVTVRDAAAVAELCTMLDGVPLGIEHAAASAGVLSPQALVERLCRGEELPAPQADLPLRQQSLRNNVAWSYSLLSPPLKRVFARLAVFQGGCTLAAAESVCLDAENGDAQKTMAAWLQALVDWSLLQCQLPAEGAAGAARLWMPETIRAYALEQLDACGERERVAQRHASYLLAEVQGAERCAVGPDASRCLAEVEAETGNLYVALSWALQSGSAAIGLGLSAALRHYWEVRGGAAVPHDQVKGLLA